MADPSPAIWTAEGYALEVGCSDAELRARVERYNPNPGGVLSEAKRGTDG
jgi:hypothetical protein